MCSLRVVANKQQEAFSPSHGEGSRELWQQSKPASHTARTQPSSQGCGPASAPRRASAGFPNKPSRKRQRRGDGKGMLCYLQLDGWEKKLASLSQILLLEQAELDCLGSNWEQLQESTTWGTSIALAERRTCPAWSAFPFTKCPCQEAQKPPSSLRPTLLSTKLHNSSLFILPPYQLTVTEQL